MRFVAFFYFIGLAGVAWMLIYARQIRERRLSIRSLFVATTLIACAVAGALAVSD